MHHGIPLIIQSWFWLIYLALYQQPVRYISNVRDRFVVREMSGYRQRVIGSWMQDGYLKSSKVWIIQGFRCVLPSISKTLWHKSHILYSLDTLWYSVRNLNVTWFLISSISAGLRTCILVWHRKIIEVGCPSWHHHDSPGIEHGTSRLCPWHR